MKTKEEIFELVEKFIKERLYSENIKLTDNWVDDLRLDSLELVETLMWLENQVCVLVTDEKAANIKTIEDLVVAVYEAQ